jgi:broad specificity phosphatase PhoE
MERQFIRHGETDGEVDGIAIGPHNFPLNKNGHIQAVHIRPKLLLEDGLDPTSMPIAVSERLRTWQTAKHIGSEIINNYAILNPFTDLTPQQRIEFRETGILPDHVLEQGQNLLDNFPQEQIIVTHGLPITAICKLLGVYQEQRHPYPDFCEIRVVDI